MVTQSDPYLVLGVSTTSEDVVIRAAFKALMLKYHPDTNISPSATTRAASINEAFSILGDPLRRAAYDLTRNASTSTPYFSPSPFPLPATLRKRRRTSTPTTRSLSNAVRGGWLALGSGLIASLLVNAVVLMAIEEADGVPLTQIGTTSIYTVGDNSTEFLSSNYSLSDNIGRHKMQNYAFVIDADSTHLSKSDSLLCDFIFEDDAETFTYSPLKITQSADFRLQALRGQSG